MNKPNATLALLCYDFNAQLSHEQFLQEARGEVSISESSWLDGQRHGDNGVDVTGALYCILVEGAKKTRRVL
jgi:hypothetical protein